MSFSGLPGAVGSVFVSRISTALHATAMAIHPALPSKHEEQPAQPSSRLVFLTLFLVTIPVEIGFLYTLRAVGWLKLPVLFIMLSVLFFCITVSRSKP